MSAFDRPSPSVRVAGIPTPALSFSESLPGFVFASPRLPSHPPSLPPSSSSVQGGGVGVGERREGGGEPEISLASATLTAPASLWNSQAQEGTCLGERARLLLGNSENLFPAPSPPPPPPPPPPPSFHLLPSRHAVPCQEAAPRGKLRGRAGRLAPRPREELGHLGGRRCVVVSPPAGRPSGSVLVTLVAVVACHLVSAFISSLPSAALGTFARDVTQPSGLSQSSGRLATLAATAPVAQRPGSVPLSPEIGPAGL